MYFDFSWQNEDGSWESAQLDTVKETRQFIGKQPPKDPADNEWICIPRPNRVVLYTGEILHLGE